MPTNLGKHARKIAAGAAMIGGFMGGSSLDDTTTGLGKKQKCNGKERWEVKTMVDEEAGDINTKRSTRTTITELVETKIRPDNWGNDAPRLEDENKLYTVKCRIIDALPQQDGDIHLALEDVDNPEATIVAEMPDPRCANVKESPYAENFRLVRNKFLTQYQHGYEDGVFEIKGVLFHDKRNHGKGGNQEGIELHPVFSIKKVKS